MIKFVNKKHFTYFRLDQQRVPASFQFLPYLWQSLDKNIRQLAIFALEEGDMSSRTAFPDRMYYFSTLCDMHKLHSSFIPKICKKDKIKKK